MADSTLINKEVAIVPAPKVCVAKPGRKRFTARQCPNKIPDEILNNQKLNQAIQILPTNYTFEVHKTVHKIRQVKAKCVALQFPEGLLRYACVLSDIVEQFTDADTIIMSDVTYGACCIDDYSAAALGCDFLVHYGHSCLISNQDTTIPAFYVFVLIEIDNNHFVDTVAFNRESFPLGSTIVIVSTVQFSRALQYAKHELEKKGYQVVIPKELPLSPGEVLGCTSPRVPEGCDAMIYLGDGRFHLESMMIHNPTLKAYAYDPYEKALTREGYDHKEMRDTRKEQIQRAVDGKVWGLIMGTLGRQGSIKVVNELKTKMEQSGKEVVVVLLSEIFPDKLRLLPDVDVWVQNACPRLSIDWGTSFDRPLLNTYEASVALERCELQVPYPMDFYANNSTGPWTPNNVKHRSKMNSAAVKALLAARRKKQAANK